MSQELRYEHRTKEYSCRDARNKLKKISCLPHLHKHLELVYMLGGTVKAIVDAHEYWIKPGDILLAFPNQVHAFEGDGCERYLLFIIDPSVISEYEDLLVMSSPCSPVISGLIQRKPHIDALFQALPDVSGRKGEEHPYCDSVRHGYLLALFGELFREMQLESPKGTDATILRAIIDYCMKNYTSELSLSVLESELHVSKYYISHLFSEQMNVRFNDYINSFRISLACRYLEQSEKTVTEISHLVGFNTLRTFNRAFVKQVGVTPSAYRRRFKSGSIPVSMPL